MNNELGGTTFLSQAALEGHEQILSYLNLENEEDFENTDTSSSFDLASIDDDELYDEIVFADDSDTNDLLASSDLVTFQEGRKLMELLGEHAYFEHDDFDTLLASDEDECYEENLEKVKRLSEMLLNKDEVEALQLQQASLLPASAPITVPERNLLEDITTKKAQLEAVAAAAAATANSSQKDHEIPITMKPEDMAYRPDYHQHYPHECPAGYQFRYPQRISSPLPLSLEATNPSIIDPKMAMIKMDEDDGEDAGDEADADGTDLSSLNGEDESEGDDEEEEDEEEEEGESEEDDEEDDHAEEIKMKEVKSSPAAPLKESKLRSPKKKSMNDEEDIEIDIENVDDDLDSNPILSMKKSVGARQNLKRSYSYIEEHSEEEDDDEFDLKSSQEHLRLFNRGRRPQLVTVANKRGPKPQSYYQQQQQQQQHQQQQKEHPHLRQRRRLTTASTPPAPLPSPPTTPTSSPAPAKRGPRPKNRMPLTPSPTSSGNSSRASSPAPMSILSTCPSVNSIPTPTTTASLVVPIKQVSVTSITTTSVSQPAPTFVPIPTTTTKQVGVTSTSAPLPTRVVNFINAPNRKLTKIEETLAFRIQHLLPSDKLTAVVKAIQNASGANVKKAVSSSKPDIELAEEFVIDLSHIPISKLLALNEFVSLQISSKSTSPSTSATPIPNPSTSLATTPNSEDLNDKGSNLRTRNRQQQPNPQEIESYHQQHQHQQTPSKSAHASAINSKNMEIVTPQSPLHVATARPLVQSYSPAPTAPTIPAFKKQQQLMKKKPSEASDEEIDVVGI